MKKKIEVNPKLKLIGNILYWILVVIVVIILFLVVLQRVTNNNMTIGGIRIFNIVTPSMVPKYVVGDVLIAKEVDVNSLQIGDDIAYRGEVGDFSGKIITHQIIDKIEENGEVHFITKGIANESQDPEIKGDQVLGIIIYKTKILSGLSKLMNNLYGFYFLVFVPLTALIIFEIRRFIKSFKNDDDEDEEDSEEKEEKKDDTNKEDN